MAAHPPTAPDLLAAPASTGGTVDTRGSSAAGNARPDSTVFSWLERRFRSSESQFWGLQFLGWIGWSTAGALQWSTWNDSNMLVPLYIAAGLGGLLVTSALRFVYRAIWDQALLLRLVTALAATLVFSAMWQVEKNVILWNFMPEMYAKEMAHHGELSTLGQLGIYLSGLLPSFYIVICWSGLYHAIRYWRMLQHERQKLLAVSAMAHQTQLKMLRYQLNPHFLFNTLNAISTLTLEQRTDLANRMVLRLSSFLRYSLDSDPMQRVELVREIDALRLYLDIEQVRFEDRLEFRVVIEDAARDALVPSLLLQPLVENAIKYAIAPSEAGGFIEIRGTVEGEMLTLMVIDSGPGIPGQRRGTTIDSRSVSSTGSGVGLANTRERLAALYGRNQSLTLENLAEGGFAVILKLPVERNRTRR